MNQLYQRPTPGFLWLDSTTRWNLCTNCLEKLKMSNLPRVYWNRNQLIYHTFNGKLQTFPLHDYRLLYFSQFIFLGMPMGDRGQTDHWEKTGPAKQLDKVDSEWMSSASMSPLAIMQLSRKVKFVRRHQFGWQRVRLSTRLPRTPAIVLEDHLY